MHGAERIAFKQPTSGQTDSTFEPVPWFLSVYLVLTIIRLILSYRRSLPSPLLYGSVIVDMGLLLGMTWIFHLQYQQSAAFYLKSPTLLYVFIFIALRALRFEARYVVTAGLFAAAGWVFLAGYALYKSGGTQGVTNTAPDVLMQLLAEYQSRLVPIIQRHGGTIDKFMGDGIMATFGAVAPNPTYAADALRAVEAVLSEAERWRAACDARGIPTCRIGTAVTEGPVIFGAVGDDTRLEYTVIGDAVNVAAKLEKYTKTEGVHALCTAGTYRKAVNQGYRSAADRQQLDGRIIEGLPQPMDVVIIAD